jgi:hypothetical protein
MLGQTSGVSFPQQNEKNIHISVCLQTLSFWGTAEQRAFHSKNVVYAQQGFGTF